MGADVYLESVSNRLREEWEPKFQAAVRARDALPKGSDTKEAQKKVEDAYAGMYSDGYYRDSYNSYGLSSNLQGFSWWRDVVPLLEDGYLPLERVPEVRAMIAEAKIDLTSAREVARKQKDPAPKRADYEKARQDILALLDRSVELGEPLYMSL